MKSFEDVQILALEQYGAGPFGSVHLADDPLNLSWVPRSE